MSQGYAPTPAAEGAALADNMGLPDILAAEYEYIAQATIQNNEDRVSGFFWLSAAAIVGAAVGLDIGAQTPPWVFLAFAIAFGLFVLLGWLAILQLAQLRAAWFSSIHAMNRIKAYYYQHYPQAARFQPDKRGDAGVFLWMKEPQRFKWRSIGLLRCLSIALIDAAFAAVGTLFAYLSREPKLWQAGDELNAVVWRGVLAGLIIASLQVWSYYLFVQRD